jgi:hypothetical protein
MRSSVSEPISHAAVRRIRDRFYPSRDRYAYTEVSVRVARRLQPENPDASMESEVMLCNGQCSHRAPTSGVPPMHVQYVAFRHFQGTKGSAHRKEFT